MSKSLKFHYLSSVQSYVELLLQQLPDCPDRRQAEIHFGRAIQAAAHAAAIGVYEPAVEPKFPADIRSSALFSIAEDGEE